MAKILAPNREYNGTSCGVTFVNGSGETDNPLRIAWFLSHGYEVEEPEGQQADIQEPEGLQESEELQEPEGKTQKKQRRTGK